MEERTMELAIVGLGRMGSNMARRLLRGGHRVVVHNRSPEPIQMLEREGAVGAYSPEDTVHALTPRVLFGLCFPPER